MENIHLNVFFLIWGYDRRRNILSSVKTITVIMNLKIVFGLLVKHRHGILVVA